MRSDLQEHFASQLQRCSRSVRELDGLAQIAPPVFRIGKFVDHFDTVDGRDERNHRSFYRQSCDGGMENVATTVARLRMKCIWKRQHASETTLTANFIDSAADSLFVTHES